MRKARKVRAHRLERSDLGAYEVWLRRRERSAETLQKYLRDVRGFYAWLDGRPVTKDTVMEWKAWLVEEKKYAPSTVNAALSAVHGLLNFMGWEECRVNFLKVQRKIFEDPNRELQKQEYERLVKTAREMGNERLALVMETICSTGIRVSELKYITVKAAKDGQTRVALKGKIRGIFIMPELKVKLLRYAKAQKITSGPIFRTKKGRPLGRKQIWKEMKRLCAYAGVDPRKVFPHNLRRLFATQFYRRTRDIVMLADVLGHSSIETTRIYLRSSGEEHQRRIRQLKLVL